MKHVHESPLGSSSNGIGALAEQQPKLDSNATEKLGARINELVEETRRGFRKDPLMYYGAIAGLSCLAAGLATAVAARKRSRKTAYRQMFEDAASLIGKSSSKFQEAGSSLSSQAVKPVVEKVDALQHGLESAGSLGSELSHRIAASAAEGVNTVYNKGKGHPVASVVVGSGLTLACGYLIRKSLKTSKDWRVEAGRKGGSAAPYEARTKDELYERAKELDVRGRSNMSKDELIDALRAS